MKVERKKLLSRATNSIKHYPVTLLIGPRQCGKTTLAKEIFDAMGGNYFDLEDPETPLKPEIAKLILKDLKGLVVIDEFQRQPELFTLIRVLADRKPLPARFLILGSASPILVRGISESLAGRVSYIRMSGFSLDEISPVNCDTLWVRGGFPLSFLAEDDQMSYEWKSNFIQTFLERDIPQLGIRIPASTLRRFWMMLAHYHGQLWNSAVLARSLGSKEDTARKYLDILTGAFLVRQLPPWFENIGKRLVKAPKVYIRDTGILHTLQGIKDKLQLQSHPNLGFSWEGFALEQVIEMTNSEEEVYFYKTHGGAELDGLLIRNGKRYGIEVKYEDSPRSSKSMHIVSQDLGLHKLWVIYPGTQTYPLSRKIEVVPFTQLRSLLEKHKLVDRL